MVGILELDQYVHRFLWRDLDVTKTPDVYIMTTVSFGNRPAGNIARVALRKTAESLCKEFPEATDTVLNSSYVDIIIDSVKTTKKAKSITKDVDHILKEGGFTVKHRTISGKEEQNHYQIYLDFPKQKVLGVQWKSESDSFCFVTSINFSPKRRNVRDGPNLTIDQIPVGIPVGLTKRMIFLF